MARIPVAWILLLVIVGIVGFFGYQIFAAYTPISSEGQISLHAPVQRPYHSEHPIQRATKTVHFEDDNGVDEHPAPVVTPQPPIPLDMPDVPGQTEEDLRAHEPLQAAPPSTQYGPPEATDPMNKIMHMPSEFGSNLRHPEQMMEPYPQRSMDQTISSGLGSSLSGPGQNSQSGYEPEMLQNGGEFMSGIVPFEGGDSGVGYSML